jgi:hypothetical protein
MIRIINFTITRLLSRCKQRQVKVIDTVLETIATDNCFFVAYTRDRLSIA